MFVKYKFFILFVFFILIGCQKSETPKNKLLYNSRDSILSNYKLSTDKSKTIKQRVKLINKAYQYTLNKNNDSVLLKILTYKSQLHSIAKQLDSAVFYSRKMLDVSKKVADSSSIGKAYYKLGLYYNKKNAIDSSYHYYNESKKIFLAINDSLQVGRKLLNMAIILSDNGDYSESDRTAIEALSYLENTILEEYKASVYNCLAISAKKQLDFEEALYWYDLAINTTVNEKNKLTYLNNTANVYTKQRKYKKAISIYSLIINDSLIKEDPVRRIRSFDNLTYAKWLLTGDKSLDKQFKEALTIRIRHNNLTGQISSYSHLSEFYEISDIEKSKQYAIGMYNISTKVNSIDDRLEALTKLMKLYNEDLELFKKYSELYLHLGDSIYKVRKAAKNQFAKIRYDSEKNRAENSSLKAKSIQKELELEKIKRQKIIYLSLGLLILLSSIFIYFQIKAKHKKEKLQQVYDTEARISKKVHDEVANDMYHVMTKLQSEVNNKDEILDDLEEIYLKTRDISKENSTIDLSENFEVVLNNLLSDYKDENINIITKNLKKINWKIISDMNKIGIYRVLQELMTNMKKHSQASLVILSFSRVKKDIVIEYKDDGIGCIIKKNTGLQNMENRILTLKGSVIFESEINQGFKVKIIV